MIVDANVLLYAIDGTSPHHKKASKWLVDALNGQERVGFPWQTIGAFLRVATHPRIATNPLSAQQAQEFVDAWLAAGPAWVPTPGREAVRIYRDLALEHQITGNLVPDAQLAACAMWLGVPVVSADSDFARFPSARWINPLA